MKPNCNFSLTILIFLLLFNSKLSYSQTESQNCKKINELIRMLEKHHFKPVLLDDKSFKEISYSFLNRLDPYKLYFTKEDLNILSKYERIPHTEYNQYLCNYFLDISQLYYNGLQRGEKLLNDNITKPNNFEINEWLELSSDDSLTFAANTIELADQWRKYLKSKILNNLIIDSNQESSANKELLQNFLKEEEQIKLKIKEQEKRRIHKIIEDDKNFNERVLSHFLNTIANRYDPHTSYFSGNEITKFQSSLSRDSFSFGFGIKENKNGKVVLSRLIPGSSAWRSNQLHKEDILVSVTTTDNKTYDFSYSDVFEVNDILRNLVSNSINLKVKKQSGEVISVKLAKEKITNEDNKIGSLLLQGEKNIGYISLPSFYTEWENYNALGCANDFAKELIKLKKENIDGLILDLRNNGGGSMKEALEMAGIFIDYGPVSIKEQRNKKPTLLRDMNRGTIYSGPLVIMVNALSASASELLAAALQDYNRAIIVGSPTFGKASGQKMMPFFGLGLDSDLSYDDLKNSLGVLKVTNFKFYRILGTSHQKSGVIPDIILPDIFDNYNFREASYPYSFEKSTIVKKLYYTLLPELPKEGLIKKSMERTQKGNYFQNIKLLNKSFLDLVSYKKSIPIGFEDYLNQEKSSNSFFSSLHALKSNESALFKIENPKYDADLIQLDKYSKELNDNLKNKLSKDKYLEEAFNIINDYILLK